MIDLPFKDGDLVTFEMRYDPGDLEIDLKVVNEEHELLKQLLGRATFWVKDYLERLARDGDRSPRSRSVSALLTEIGKAFPEISENAAP